MSDHAHTENQVVQHLDMVHAMVRAVRKYALYHPNIANEIARDATELLEYVDQIDPTTHVDPVHSEANAQPIIDVLEDDGGGPAFERVRELQRQMFPIDDRPLSVDVHDGLPPVRRRRIAEEPKSELVENEYRPIHSRAFVSALKARQTALRFFDRFSIPTRVGF